MALVAVACAALAAGMVEVAVTAASTSPAVMRPFAPVPVIVARSVLCCRDRARTRGVRYGERVARPAQGSVAERKDASGSVAAAAAGGEAALVPMMASSVPKFTVAFSGTAIEIKIPVAGDGIWVSTLSVDTSSSGSAAVTESPTPFSQRVIVPSEVLFPEGWHDDRCGHESLMARPGKGRATQAPRRPARARLPPGRQRRRPRGTRGEVDGVREGRAVGLGVVGHHQR